jgi:hypothetical protein
MPLKGAAAVPVLMDKPAAAAAVADLIAVLNKFMGAAVKRERMCTRQHQEEEALVAWETRP